MWAYDESNDSYTTLPAGPFLLPSLLVYGAACLLSRFIPEREPAPYVATSFIEEERKKKRYLYLTQKQAIEPLPLWEAMELHQIKYPCGSEYPPIHYEP